MAKKRKTLPKDFDKLIEAGDINALKAVFDKCELNAYSGYNKETAFSFYNVPEELVRWLVEQGADINNTDIYNSSALHQQAMRRYGNIEVLLELGANMEAVDLFGDTPLHMAAENYNLLAIQQLLALGANSCARNERGQTPLEQALSSASNADIEDLVEIAELFLGQGEEVTPELQKQVVRIGEDFEFHRDGFNKDMLEDTDTALNHLYKMFDVAPVEKRKMHDGKSPIIPNGKTCQEKYDDLWELLIPSSGSAKTVQGEVIRITGKIHDEIFRNGGCNWGNFHKQMLDALIVHFGSGVPLDSTLLKEATKFATAIRRSGDGEEEPSRLCELAVKWVLLNPEPVLLAKPDYDI